MRVEHRADGSVVIAINKNFDELAGDFSMFQEKLRLRLESGEPKCKNCTHAGESWRGARGWCCHPDHVTKPFVDAPEATLGMAVTDLTVCSKWEQKD